MKQKIHREFALVALATIFLTTILITAVFYGCFQREIMEELGTCTRMLRSIGVSEALEEPGGAYDSLKLQGLRVSLISSNGDVLYDNGVSVGGLDNHKDRPEIAEARERGSGQAVRRSDTLDRNAFYYAVCLPDGMILRTARDSSSMYGIFVNALPAVLAAAAAVLLFCFYLSVHSARILIRPVEHLAEHLDAWDEFPVYQEMLPFVQKIRRQHEDLMRTVRLRQEFTANVSHELKTPLTAISGYAELIEHHMAPGEEIQRFGAEIHRSASRLLRMIDDIIRLSELDVMEEEAFVLEKVPLYQLAKISVDMLQFHAKRHQVELYVYGSPCSVRGDKEMMEEVLYNLCDNGIRYNREGGRVTVTVEPAGDKVCLRVEDTGIGIPKEHQERVFERFYRVDKSRSKATGGTGLGLAIVKHIAALHHGELILESAEGEGTRITLWLDRFEEETVLAENGRERR